MYAERSVQQTYVVGATAIGICSNSPTRCSLTLTAHGGDIYVSHNRQVTVGHGLLIPSGQYATTLERRIQGEWVSESLYAIASAGGATLTVLEGHCGES